MASHPVIPSFTTIPIIWNRQAENKLIPAWEGL
jgi:hypothetical protein